MRAASLSGLDILVPTHRPACMEGWTFPVSRGLRVRAILFGGTVVMIWCRVRCRASVAFLRGTTSSPAPRIILRSGIVLLRREARGLQMHQRCDLYTFGRHRKKPLPGDLETR